MTATNATRAEREQASLDRIMQQVNTEHMTAIRMNLLQAEERLGFVLYRGRIPADLTPAQREVLAEAQAAAQRITELAAQVTALIG